jgi:GNAT superfamily N-acetyltransferase
MHATTRWMIRRDVPDVLAIAASTHLPFDEDQLIRWLRRCDCIGRVAEHSERLVGFSVYRLLAHKLDLEYFAVHPDFRGQGVGRKLIGDLLSKLSPAYGKRYVLDCMIPETDLELLQFFRHFGFVGTLWPRQFGDVDGVRMRYDVRELALV